MSTDDGQTWQHFRTIDRSVLVPAGCIEPESDPGMTRAIDWVGAVPDDWGHLDYPNIGFCQDNVIVSWTRAVPRPLAGQHQGARLLVAPISWFYEDEPAYQAPAKSPQLLVGAADTQIPATWIENRFVVNFNDVARALGCEVPRNMLGTLHQVLTCLEVEAVFDRSKMDDVENPVLRVTLKRQ